jgi:hypothetical protein
MGMQNAVVTLENRLAVVTLENSPVVLQKITLTVTI